jgi:hypothetical protein
VGPSNHSSSEVQMRVCRSRSKQVHRGIQAALLGLLAGAIAAPSASMDRLDAGRRLARSSSQFARVGCWQTFSPSQQRIADMPRSRMLSPDAWPLLADRPGTRPDQLTPQTLPDIVKAPTAVEADDGTLSPVLAHGRYINPAPDLRPVTHDCRPASLDGPDAPPAESLVADGSSTRPSGEDRHADRPGMRPGKERFLLEDRPGTRPDDWWKTLDRPGTRPDDRKPLLEDRPGTRPDERERE